MGSTLEVVNVVLSNAIAFSSLLVAIASWRSSRPKPTKIKVERNGVEVPLAPEQK